MHCKDCKHRSEEGLCLNESAVAEDVGQEENEADCMLIYPYNEGGYFRVGPNFGCVHFEGKDAGVDNIRG